MRLEDMLKDVSGITQKVVDSNCFQGANTLLENILLIQTKVNEVIKAINDGIIKGDKGDKGDTGETGEKGDKGDTGKATESIQDNVTSLDTTWSSTKIDSCFNDIKNIQGVKYGNDVGYQVCKGTHKGIVKDIKVYGKSEVIEGKIVSVGNGNKIEVSSIKWSGNLFDESQLKPYIKSENDIEYEINYEKVWTDKAKLAQLPFKENTQYKFICSQKTSTADSKPRFYFVYTDGSKDEMTIATTEYTEVTGFSRANKTLDYISVTYGVSGAKFTVKKNSICLYENTSKSVYEPYKEDKKTILFKDTDNTWKPITELNEWDLIDTTVNKLVVSTEKPKFTTNLNWRDNGNTVEGFKTYWIKYVGYKLSNVICDKLPVFNVATFDKKCMFVLNNEYLYITIPTSECSDVSKLGEWFVANPMNILIPSPKKEYEINPIYTESFDNETMILFNTGVIPCKNEFYIDSNLGSLQIETNERLSKIENTIYQSNIAILRGDFRTLAQMYYPNDFIKKEELPNE